MALPWFKRFDDALTTRFPLPIGVCPEDSEEGAWFLSPSQHLIESSVMIVLCSTVMIIAGRKMYKQVKAEERTSAKAGAPVRKPDPPSALVRFFDVLLSTILFASLCTVVVHKWNAVNKMPYLLQPCHLLHAFMLYILTLPRGSTRGAVLLSIYLHELSAPFLGTVAADLTCYKQRFEALNWGVQHGMLLIMPLYLLATRRFGDRVHGGAALFFFSFAAMTLLHYLILVPVSVLTSTNLNYVMCAPPVMQSLPIQLGKYYRTPNIVLCGLLAWGLRYIVVDAFLRCVVDRTGRRDSQRSLAKVEPEDSGDEAASKKADKAQQHEGLRKRN